MLNDLWDVDGGLNGDVTAVSVDLSQKRSLPESEQAAVAWAFAGGHGISDPLTLSYEELAAEGYLAGTEPDSDGIPCWEDGCLFTIAEQETGDNELNGARNTVTFDAQKLALCPGGLFLRPLHCRAGVGRALGGLYRGQSGHILSNAVPAGRPGGENGVIDVE